MIPADKSFVLLDASLTVGSALSRMDRFKKAHWVVVRRSKGAQVYWYTYEAGEARDQFTRAPSPDQTVQEVLDLHEWRARSTHPTDGTAGEVPQRGDIVFAPSNQVVGVAMEPPARPAAAPPRRRRSGGGGPPCITLAEPPVVRAPWETGAPPEYPAPASGPFRAWPDLQAPLAVEDGAAFDLMVGFALQQIAGVTGGIVELPAMPLEFDLQVQLVAIDFDSPKGSLHTLHVFRDDPERGKLRLNLIAKIRAWPPQEPVVQRVLGIIFSYQGMPCGMAQRNILVAQPGFALSAADLGAPTSFANQSPRGVPVWVRGDVAAPDLTVTLRRYDGNVARANFAWSFESPHPVKLPTPIPCGIADDAASYARGITSEIVELGEAGSALVRLHAEGSGRDIADHVPRELWDAIAEVCRHLGQTRKVPDVFFLTEESCIPWELALMPKPLDPAQPAFLGAQVNFGRWIVGDPTPHVPPEPSVDVRRMVVVYGDYPKASDRLPEALEERDRLAANYTATTVAIDDAAVVNVLQGTDPDGGCQLLHFACHGGGDPTDPAHTRLKTSSGAPLTDNALRGAALGEQNSPFLFLNACEAGTAGDELGATSGFVEAALKSGFRGFVGALWEVASETARDIAIEFYKRTLDEGASVAEAMREMRCRFGKTQQVPDDTYLAYVFYGHPGLKLQRKP
jgi:hypothetical protein